MHEPPVQSDCCALPGNYRLESNPERHANAPLAAATGRQNVREMYREFLKWGQTEATLKGRIWWHVSRKTVTTVRESAKIN